MKLIEFTIAALAIELMPGPNMAWLAALSAAQGRRAGLYAVAGIGAGLAFYGIAAAAGLAALVTAAPIIFEVLRWLGFVYLLWLAVDAWRSAAPADAAMKGVLTLPPGEITLARQGFLINVLNPKAGMFYLVVLPRFLDAGAESTVSSNLSLVAIYVFIATSIHVAIAVAAAAFGSVLPPGSRSEIFVRRTLALVLLGVAIWLLIDTRPSV